MMNKNKDWIDFVKLYQKETGLPWNISMKQAGDPYRRAQIDRILQERSDTKFQSGGVFNMSSFNLGNSQIDKLINYAIQLVGTNKFFGLDANTVSELINLVIETGKSAGSLTEILTLIQKNPYAVQISKIPFTKGPEGVKADMQSILQMIDSKPNNRDIYTALCTIYRAVLNKTSKIFIKIIGSVSVGSAETKNNLQNGLIQSIQNLNYNALESQYNSLPSLIKQLIEDPNALGSIIEKVMVVLSSANSSLGTFIKNNLYPVLNSTIEAVRRIIPITFASMILLDRCGSIANLTIQPLAAPTQALYKTTPNSKVMNPVATPNSKVMNPVATPNSKQLKIDQLLQKYYLLKNEEAMIQKELQEQVG